MFEHHIHSQCIWPLTQQRSHRLNLTSPNSKSYKSTLKGHSYTGTFTGSLIKVPSLITLKEVPLLATLISGTSTGSSYKGTITGYSYRGTLTGNSYTGTFTGSSYEGTVTGYSYKGTLTDILHRHPHPAGHQQLFTPVHWLAVDTIRRCGFPTFGYFERKWKGSIKKNLHWEKYEV